MNGPIQKDDVTTHAQIAVADDDVVIRRFYERALTHLGYDVVGPAQDGQELVELCRHHNPDVIVTDIAMPRLDGVAALREIYTSQTIPAIIVSGNPNSCSLDKALNFPTLFLNKPISLSDLAAAIKSVCSL